MPLWLTAMQDLNIQIHFANFTHSHPSGSGGPSRRGGGGAAGRRGAPGPHAHGNAARQVVDDWRAEVHGQRKPSIDPRNTQQPAQPRYANYWAPLTNKRHSPQPAQPRHTNHSAPRMRKQHQQEHRPQRPTKCSDPTQHAKGRMGDCPGPRKETATRRNVTKGGVDMRGDSFIHSFIVPQCSPCLGLCWGRSKQ